MLKTTEIKVRTQTIKGVEYVYEDHPYWDKEKQQMRHKREYIGKTGSDGEVIYNKKYLKRSNTSEKDGAKEVSKLPVVATRKYYGAIYLFNQISERIGLVKDLKECFPEIYKQLLSIAYFLVLENDVPMQRFKKWSITHEHPYQDEISSQRISELFAMVTENAKMSFFKLRAKHCLKSEYLAYDTTSISSYSEMIKEVKYGHNKDLDGLEQLNLALVFGEESMLPVYYRKLPGNIHDVSTIKKLLSDIDFLSIAKVNLVMDRGFYSAENINDMYHNHYKFLIGTRSNLKFVTEKIEKARDIIKNVLNYSVKEDVYSISSTDDWAYEYKNSKGKALEQGKRRIYTHVYYDGQRAESEKSVFIKQLASIKEAVLAGETLSRKEQALFSLYCTEHETPVRGKKVTFNEESICAHTENMGFFVLISNQIKDSERAIYLYRNKDLIEKAFWNLKNRLNMRRTTVHSSENMEGKLFVQFLALIIVSFIDSHMKKHNLYKNYTMMTLLDELDIIERFIMKGSSPHLSEITSKQRAILSSFDMEF